MLDLRQIVSERETVEKSLKKRSADTLIPVVDALVELDKSRREMILEGEELKHQRNQASQEIAQKKKSGGDVSDIMEKMKTVSARIKQIDTDQSKIQEEIQKHLWEIPNVLDESVPQGKDSTNNKEVRSWGEHRTLDFQPKTHFEIGEALGILDFKSASEVTGARFAFLKGDAARLERALINFMLDEHRKNGYEEIAPPFLVNRTSLVGTGQLPKFEEDVFHIEKYDFFLIPTAEVPVTNYHRGGIISDDQMPRKYVAYTPCFRSEAGSYGKDTKGLKRQHQFNKVELVKFCRPKDSMAELEALTRDAEGILQKLELPYRVSLLCGGDTGFSSAKTYDLEVWSPAQNEYMEISSCSNFHDYQARRANIRYRSAQDNKVHFVHTLNGSGLAVGRTLIAIMENYQKADGTFDTPAVLSKYL